MLRVLRQGAIDFVSFNLNPSMKHLLHGLHANHANLTAMKLYRLPGSSLFAMVKIFEIEMFLRDFIFISASSMTFMPSKCRFLRANMEGFLCATM